MLNIRNTNYSTLYNRPQLSRTAWNQCWR